jgi:hypothetical protein
MFSFFKLIEAISKCLSITDQAAGLDNLQLGYWMFRKNFYFKLKRNPIKCFIKSTKQKEQIRVFSFHPSKKVVNVYHFMQKKSFL